MSISKPFRLQNLPRLAFEQVLHQMYPLDLFELSNVRSKKLLNRVKDSLLALHCDILCSNRSLSAEITIKMRSGYTLKWGIIQNNQNLIAPKYLYNACFLEGNSSFLVFNDSLKLECHKCSATDTIVSLFHVTEFENKTEPFFSQLLHKFPCPIRTLSIDSLPETPFLAQVFDWKTVKTCEHLEMICYTENSFRNVLDTLEVTREISVDYCRIFYKNDNINFCSDILRNIQHLNVLFVKNYTGDALNRESNNEHFVLEFGRLLLADLVEYFKNWQNGAHCKLKTFMYRRSNRDNLLPLPSNLVLQTLLPKNGPRFVRCAHYYIDTTIQTETEFQTVHLTNCHGKRATLSVTSFELYFAVWDEPNAQVEIPKSHRMARIIQRNTTNFPVHMLVPLFPEIFEDDEKVRLDLEGFMSDRQRRSMKDFWYY